MWRTAELFGLGPYLQFNAQSRPKRHSEATADLSEPVERPLFLLTQHIVPETFWELAEGVELRQR
jgi:hypothetical protein